MITLRLSQQSPKDPWTYWIILAGRGFGKTTAGAHCVFQWIQNNKKTSIALIGATQIEVIHVMLFGKSGLITLMNYYNYDYVYKKAQNKIIINNIELFLFSGERPDKLRGFQFDGVWIDEFSKFSYIDNIMDQLHFCMRQGHPQFIITTTPKPIALLKTLITKQNVIVTSGSSYENLDNLSPYFQEFLKIYEGTSMGEQEIHGKIIYANNSPWADVKIEYINNIRVENLCLGVDPSTKNKNEIGLVICGIDYRGIFVVIEDCSKQLFVHQWMEYIGDLCKEYPIKILCIETNQGGDLINFALKSHLPSHVIIKETFSKSSKLTRALGIASLYHNKKVVHLKKFPILEKQMFEFSGSKDRVDALGFAITGLLNKTNNKSHAPWLL